ncbi:outer membrane beta-barrel protein [Lichenihabitans sp. Uapishka_5]|uniref:outer membrane beta-barrel protein n=1 Tax=Lichenihabitans sp. Uapishka_5 TaxID=3037302 RepID=UPI0029E7FB4E|nr:outer membrane beta-barrel protein [Lichenihabitans sp. Uapishka_5]MDX7953039.1 outer membrane beta-barrel protein [Lichenihabitans sp. Uapishka_5]
MTSAAPRPPTARLPHRRSAWLVGPVVCLVLAGPLRAQDAGGVDGGFGGMRGTVDATGDGPGLDGFVAPTSNVAGLGAAPKPVPQADRLHLPRMRNAARPERQPVALPALEAYPRALRLKGGGAADIDPNTPVAALPVLPRRSFRPEDAPFAPVGYGTGGLRAFPYIQQSLGFDSSPDQVSSGIKASPYSRTEAGLTLQSDWAVHELRGTLYGAYDSFFRNHNADRPDANGVVDWTIHATRDTSIDTELRFNVDTQRPGSPELNIAVDGRPLVEGFGGTLGVTQGFGRFSVGLHGLVDRTTYDDATLSDGVAVDLAYQNVTDYGAKLRVGYDLKPGLQPFVEVGADERLHDRTVDPSGYRRDSDGTAARLGTAFELFPELTGTVSAGYATRFYDDPRLKTLDGPVADVALAWAATPLTTLSVNGATSFNETTVPGASGIESRTIGAVLSHALFRYLTLSAALIYQNNAYEGAAITENVLTESLKAEYHLSRAMVLTGTLSHQKLKSTIAGSDYTQNVALLGLRFQH